jgi:YVTN family beta-propeller protein
MKAARIACAVIATLSVLLLAGVAQGAQAPPASAGTTCCFAEKNTVLLYNDSIAASGSTVPQPNAPVQLVWDAKGGNLYVSDASGVLLVVNPLTGLLQGSYFLGSPLGGVAVDNKTSQVYVSEPTVDQVAVVNETTGAVVARVGVGSSPEGILFDPITDRVYVANFASNNLSVIDPATQKVTRTISGVYGPLWLTLDTMNGHFFVADRPASCTNGPPPSACSLTDVDAATRAVLWNVTEPLIGQMAFDPVNGDVYAPELGNGTVSVVQETTGRTVATVHTGPTGGGEYPMAAALDPVNGQVYVINEFAANFTVINASTNRMVQSTVRTWETNVDSLVFDSKTGQLYGSNTLVASVIEYAPTTLSTVSTVPLATDPWGVLYNPFNTELYVQDSDSGSLYVLNGSTEKTITRVADAGGYYMAVDATDGSVFWANNTGIVEMSATGVLTGLKDPYGALAVFYDPATGDLAAINDNPSGVSIIHVATDVLVRTLHYSGFTVSGLAYDSNNGVLYAPMYSGASGYWADKVLEIDGSTAAPLGNLTIPSGVGNETGAATYDDRTGTIFVANFDTGAGANNVLGISVKAGALAGIVQTGGFVNGWLAFDGANGDLYVELEDNSAAIHLVQVAPGNYSVLGTVALSGSDDASGLAIDAHTGAIWAAVSGVGRLYVVTP